MPAVSYRLSIEEKAASPALLDRIQRIEIEEHAEMADMLRLEMAIAVKEDESGWTVVDEGLFSEQGLLQVAVQVGPAPPKLILDAFVIETNASFSNEPGTSTLEVVAMDATERMNQDVKIREWANMADSDIAREILGEYDLEPKVERTEPTARELEAPVIQHGTDAQFLRKLANRNGYVFYVETNPRGERREGHFHPPRLEAADQPMLHVSAGPNANVTSFDVRFDMTAPVRAAASGVEIASREAQNAQVSETERTLLGERPTVNGQSAESVLTGAAQTRTAELQAYAQAVVDRSAFAITAQGELHTAAYNDVLRAKRPVVVSGAGRDYSGRYYVQRVLHAITGEAYTQQFTLRRNALGA